MDMVTEAMEVDSLTIFGASIEQGKQEKRAKESLHDDQHSEREAGRKTTLILRNSKEEEQRE